MTNNENNIWHGLSLNTIYNMDCIEGMKLIPDWSIDAIITDPPYEIWFMGKWWDDTGIANNVDMWKECLRVLKPWWHLLSFAATRTYHRMASAIEDAGFEIRNFITRAYWSWFPKSLNIGKAVDKLQRGNKTISLINALLEKGKTLKELGEMAGIPSLESSYRDWTTGGHKPEERSWAKDDWQGKNQNTTAQSIFTYLGGYNCMHVLLPISKERYEKLK